MGVGGPALPGGLPDGLDGDLDRIAAGALARQAMLEGFWGPFDAALGETGGLTRKTVRAAVEARLDAFLFGQDGTDPKRRRCPACGGDTLELKLSSYGPFVGCAKYPECGYRRSLSAAAAERDGYAGPRELGADAETGMAVTLRRGPTGWYVQRGERADKVKPDRMSLPPSLEADDIDLGLALRLLALGLPVHLMILRWPDGPVATPWPRSERTVRERRRARRSGPRRQCRPGGRTSRPGPCAARASPRSP